MPRTIGHAGAVETEFDEAEAREIVRAQDAVEAEARSIAHNLGYALPGGAVDPDLIQRDIAANMRRSVEAVLEMGRGLVVLKGAVGHGNFTTRLEQLGIEPRVARRLMETAVRFSNRATSSGLISAVGTQSQLFELLILDDDQIEELEEAGHIGELHLDKISTMTTRELRARLREVQANYEQRGKLLSAKDETINRLSETSGRKREPTPDARRAELLAEIVSADANARGWVLGSMLAAMTDLREHDLQAGDDHGAVMAGFLDGLIEAIEGVRFRLGLPARRVAQPIDPNQPIDEDEMRRTFEAQGLGDRFDADGRFVPLEG